MNLYDFLCTIWHTRLILLYILIHTCIHAQRTSSLSSSSSAPLQNEDATVPSVAQQSEPLERATGESCAQASALASSVAVPVPVAIAVPANSERSARSDATAVSLVPSTCTVSVSVTVSEASSLPLPLPQPVERERECGRSRSRAPSVARRVIRKRIVHRYIPLLAAPAGRSAQHLQLQLQQVLASRAAATGFGRRFLLTQPAVLQQQPQPQQHQLSPSPSLDASHLPLGTCAPGTDSALTHNLLVHRTFPNPIPNPIASSQHRTPARPPQQTLAPRCSRYSVVRNAAAHESGGSACVPSTKYVYVPTHKTSLPLVSLLSSSGSSRSPLNPPAPAATSSSPQTTCQMPAGPSASMAGSSHPGCCSSAAPLSSSVIPSLVRVSSGASYSAPQPEGVRTLHVIVSNATATHSRYPICTSADVAVSAEEATQQQPPSVASSNVDASATGTTARASPVAASGADDTIYDRSTQYSHARQQRVHSAISSNSTLNSRCGSRGRVSISWRLRSGTDGACSHCVLLRIWRPLEAAVAPVGRAADTPRAIATPMRGANRSADFSETGSERSGEPSGNGCATS